MFDHATTETFDAFFVGEFPRLVAMLTAWSGSRSVAEELAQDALLQALQRWEVVAGLDSPGAWVRRVALNRSANEGRRRRRERAATDRLRNAAESSQWEPAVVDDALWSRVRALSAAQRDAVVLRYVDDLPLAEIARVMGCAEGTVKKHLQRARAALAAHITNDGSSE